MINFAPATRITASNRSGTNENATLTLVTFIVRCRISHPKQKKYSAVEISVLLLRHDHRNAACALANAAEMECDTGIVGSLAGERLEEGPGVARAIFQHL